MTMPVPSASASGRSRRGLRISAAAKVTLAHASAENSPPTIAAPNAAANPKSRERVPKNAVALPKLAAIAAGLRAMRHPTTLIIKSESSFALVNRFWISLPKSSPRRLLQVKSAITAIASSRSPDSPMPPMPSHSSAFDHRKEHAAEAREGNGDRRDGSGLNDQ